MLFSSYDVKHILSTWLFWLFFSNSLLTLFVIKEHSVLYIAMFGISHFNKDLLNKCTFLSNTLISFAKKTGAWFFKKYSLLGSRLSRSIDYHQCSWSAQLKISNEVSLMRYAKFLFQSIITLFSYCRIFAKVSTERVCKPNIWSVSCKNNSGLLWKRFNPSFRFFKDRSIL